MMVTNSPPKALPIKYSAPLGTRWAKEKAAAGGSGAFDLPTDPKNIGPWILGECIGKGASGRVKIAKHRRTGQLAAVKILPVAPLVSSRASLATQQAKSDKQRMGIDREITMMKLMNHPNIMRIYDVFEGDKELFLVLEYVEGGELFDFLVNRGRLPPYEALQYFQQIVYGLNYAHTFSIIHRDLKPENILIASLDPPLVKIADWGMAAFAPPSLELETSCGSPHYASPEIVNGEKYQGNATDIWSCGVILYALLTGRLPFDDKNVRTLLAKVKSGKYDMPTWIDPLAKDLLEKMLVVDVRRRITIPDILSHPWMLTQPSPTSQSSMIPEVLKPRPPPLPPSPSTLARPIPSFDLIDRELLSSLRIIWGRHTDPHGESIKRDLCSPAGHGVHAKAFYFLLGKYREESSRNDLEDKENSQNTKSNTGSQQGNLKANFEWKPNNSCLRKHNVKRSSIPTPYLNPNPIIGAPGPIPTFMMRSRTVTEGSLVPGERSASPAGPRPLPVNAGRVQTDIWKAQVQAYSRSASSYSAYPPSCPGSSVGAGREIYRPLPPRRGHTYSSVPNGQEGPNASHTVGTGFSRNIQGLQTKTSPLPQRHQQRPKSAVGLPASHGDDERKIKFPTGRSPSPSLISAPLDPVTTTSNAAASVSSPKPSLNVLESPVLTAPKTGNFELQKTMDAIAERVDYYVQAAASESGMRPSVLRPLNTSRIMSSDFRQHVSSCEAKGRKTQETSQPDDNKENQTFSDEGWSYIGVDDGNASGIGLGVGQDNGNVGSMKRGTESIVSLKGKKNKEKKARPPPLELPTLNQKRSTLSILGSPINLSSPMYPAPPSSSRLLASPVVGEFKGWFSNLFTWKTSQVNGHGGILYSSNDISKTCSDVERILQLSGIIVEKTTSSDATDSGQCFKCRIEQPAIDFSTSLTLKPVRFRVELSLASAYGEGQSPQLPHENPYFPGPTSSSNRHYLTSPDPSHGALRARASTFITKNSGQSTPLPSPNALLCGEFPPLRSCAIAMVYEKGSMSTFRNIWKKLREQYADGTVAYPCFSPAIPNTPVEEHH